MLINPHKLFFILILFSLTCVSCKKRQPNTSHITESEYKIIKEQHNQGGIIKEEFKRRWIDCNSSSAVKDEIPVIGIMIPSGKKIIISLNGIREEQLEKAELIFNAILKNRTLNDFDVTVMYNVEGGFVKTKVLHIPSKE